MGRKKNKVMRYLRIMAGSEFLDNEQKEYFRQMLADAREVEVVPLRRVFSPLEIEIIKKQVAPKAKQCYRNAFLLCAAFPDKARYVEGKMTLMQMDMCIDHAWNCVNGKYVDVTRELALNDRNIEDYAALGEYDGSTVGEIILEHGYYGEIYETIYKRKKVKDNGKVI